MFELISQPFFIAAAVGIASGGIGAFVILRRMALVGDALSHVALPGIALALAYGIDPFWGVLGFLTIAAVLVWWLEGKTKLPTDTLVGLLFTASLAIGILTIPDHEIIESLFGEFPEFSPVAFLFVIAAAMGAALGSFFFAKRFLSAAVLGELAPLGKKRKWDDLLFFLTFSFVVALGIKLVGTLLMGALTIIPAASAKNVCRSLKSYFAFSALLGGFISVAGVVLSQYFGFLPGPTIILLGVAIFLLSLFLVRK